MCCGKPPAFSWDSSGDPRFVPVLRLDMKYTHSLSYKRMRDRRLSDRLLLIVCKT